MSAAIFVPMKRKEREVQYRNKCAFRIQKIWRGILTRRMFSAYILETRCAIIIQMFYRYYRSYRESAVFRIQRLWLRARISGTTGFTKHYRKVKQRLYQTTKLTQCQLKSGCVLNEKGEK